MLPSTSQKDGVEDANYCSWISGTRDLPLSTGFDSRCVETKKKTPPPILPLRGGGTVICACVPVERTGEWVGESDI